MDHFSIAEVGQFNIAANNGVSYSKKSGSGLNLNMVIENKCYASGLGECGGALSSEHYISQGVLRLIGSSFDLSGTAWLKGKTRSFTTSSLKALTSKILCAKHNNLLSPIDDIAIKFFGTLKQFNHELSKKNCLSNAVVLSGYELERWFIKLYLGLHCGKQLNSKLENVELYLLETLFYGKRLPKDFGLYFGRPTGSRIATFNGLSITTYNNEAGSICAVGYEIIGFPFYLSIRPVVTGATGIVDPPIQYHPHGITLQNASGTAKKEMRFQWYV